MTGVLPSTRLVKRACMPLGVLSVMAKLSSLLPSLRTSNAMVCAGSPGMYDCPVSSSETNTAAVSSISTVNESERATVVSSTLVAVTVTV